MGGREDRHGHVAQPVDDAVHARRDVPRHLAAAGRGDAGDPVQVVALVLGEAERAGEGAEHLGRRVQRPALLEAHDVVDADARERGELLAAEASGAAVGSRGQAHVGGLHALAPGAEHAREFGHDLILRPPPPGSLVPVVPLSAGAWATRPGRRRLDA